ncbi:MAG: CHASE2 domain-containing protein [Aphanocapsa sp. GSE-SYN-MK-11-07L]|jgi:hypothetical protein|nr:CHASE2 domain-containing protein [Aphanocapsa sp. GSE-SYN-MK-11-07L]
MTDLHLFRLEVQQVDQSCLFQLSWGKGQQLRARLPYPESLPRVYQDWQRAYRSFYGSAAVRGQAEVSNTLTLTDVDWRIRLVQAEAALLSEFHHWLRSAELYEIRAAIASATKHLGHQSASARKPAGVDLFLTCDPIALEHLPWETWEIGAELGAGGGIRIIRSPINIQHEAVQQRRGRTRILVILGDDTGLDFRAEIKAIEQKLKPVADVIWVGLTSPDVAQLKIQIRQALVSELGWDILLFFGHSNEAALTGGELAIAPHTWISVREIMPQLLKAKEHGLQFALFNSCNGLNIAGSLVNLGLSQVAVMREPIHNAVAHTFLVRFLQELAQHRDVQEAMIAATQDLKLNHNLTFPSTYLIPSLFRHPEAPLFQLKPWGLRQGLQQLVPNRMEAIALSALLALSLLPKVQDLLLQSRLGAQAVYRSLTQQIPPKSLPPVQLIHIDQDSLTRAKIPADKYDPMDRSYLASVLNKLSSSSPQVIGIDYLLDRPTPEDPQFVAVVRQLVKKGNWVILATSKDNNGNGPQELVVGVEGLSQDWSLQANIDFPFGYVELPPQDAKCQGQCPFAYMLGLIHCLQTYSPPLQLKPQLESKTDLGNQVFSTLQSLPPSAQVGFWRGSNSRLNAVTSFSHGFGQSWLQPIVDFSIPPSQVYERIPAWQVLASTRRPDSVTLAAQPIVILAPGEYEPEQSDTFPLPLATSFWRSLEEKAALGSEEMTGSEIHAYMVHHLLAQHLVVPIPDLWLVGIAIVIGKGAVIVLAGHQFSRRWWVLGMVGGTLAYGMIGLQVFVSYGVLLPWLLPTMTVWGYLIPTWRQAKA